MRKIRQCRRAFTLSAGCLVLAVLVGPTSAGQSGPVHGTASAAGQRYLLAHDDGTGCLTDLRAGYGRSVHVYEVPDVGLIDSDGKPYSLRAALSDRSPLLLNFIFTSCPTICPIMSATFSQAQPELAAEGVPPRMLSISIDPEYDTPARLKEYAEKFGATSGWEFLTGDRETIVAVQKAFDAFLGDKMSHRPLTFLRHPGTDAWVRLEGLTSADALVREYRELMAGSRPL